MSETKVRRWNLYPESPEGVRYHVVQVETCDGEYVKAEDAAALEASRDALMKSILAIGHICGQNPFGSKDGKEIGQIQAIVKKAWADTQDAEGKGAL